jgi:hypothetical protein
MSILWLVKYTMTEKENCKPECYGNKVTEEQSENRKTGQQLLDELFT